MNNPEKQIIKYIYKNLTNTYIETIEYMLQNNKINYFYQDIDGNTILNLAIVLGNNYETVDMLLENGYTSVINLPNNSDVTPLGSAARRGEYHISELLIRHGADVSVRDIHSQSILNFRATSILLCLIELHNYMITLNTIFFIIYCKGS